MSEMTQPLDLQQSLDVVGDLWHVIRHHDPARWNSIERAMISLAVEIGKMQGRIGDLYYDGKDAADQHDAAVLAERERCAAICAANPNTYGDILAAKIRSGTEQPNPDSRQAGSS